MNHSARIDDGEKSLSTEKTQPRKAGFYSWYVVIILMIAYTFSFIDRQILALLVEPIKADLGFSDTQVSLLYGLAFAVFYTTLGLPIARLADASNRRNLIAVGILLWSAMTAVCGMVRTFPGLFMARVGVGVGEAALSPAAYSMIGDYFPRHQLGRALSVYGTGIFVGAGLAIIIGGQVVSSVASSPDITLPFIGTIRPWQLTFMIVGLPGVLITAVLLATVREPVRLGRISQNSSGAVPLSEAISFIRQHLRLFSGHFLSFGFISLSAYAMSSWTPTWLIRVQQWTPAEVAWKYGPIVLVFGTAGILTGGFISDRLLKKGRSDAPIITALVAALLMIIPSGTATLSDNPTVFLPLICLATLLLSVPFGIAVAALQMVTPNELRALLGALYLFTINLLGLAVGPTAVAITTDYVFADPMAVGKSIALIAAISTSVAVVFYLLTLRPFRLAVADNNVQIDS